MIVITVRGLKYYAFVSLAAELLYCQDAGGGSCANQLPGMASLLSNTGSVLQPESPCSSPTSTDPADLEAWNCKDHMIHIRFLLQLVNRVTLLAHYHIGGFLRQTSLMLVPPLLRTPMASWWPLQMLVVSKSSSSTAAPLLPVGVGLAPAPSTG